MVEELYYGSIYILDFYHLKEKVFDYSKELFHDDDKAKIWSADISTKLRQSKYFEVLQILEPYKNLTLKNINLYRYINNNINCIDYAKYESKGYFIGSGAIESSNKIVLQERLKRSGQRWNIPTAQNLVTLREKVESDLWDSDVSKLILSLYEV